MKGSISIQPKIASEGAGALPASTVPHVFKNTIDKVGDKPALLFQPNGAEGYVPSPQPYLPSSSAC
jgi:hypothetical protein